MQHQDTTGSRKKNVTGGQRSTQRNMTIVDIRSLSKSAAAPRDIDDLLHRIRPTLLSAE